jgi:hypothetical protein
VHSQLWTDIECDYENGMYSCIKKTSNHARNRGENYLIIFSTIMNMILVFAIMIPLALAVYFLIRKIQRSLNIMEGKAINYLHKKASSINDTAAARPDITRVVFYILRNPEYILKGLSFPKLYLFFKAYYMHQQKIIYDNEWLGWLDLIKSSFENEAIKKQWTEIEHEKLFDSSFRNFINNEINK